MGLTMTTSTDKEWVDMPEFKNDVGVVPAVVAIFKFRTRDDFLKFKELLNKHLTVGGVKYFNGFNQLNHKTTWWPKEANMGSHKYIDGVKSE
jgi:hypothetical protein